MRESGKSQMLGLLYFRGDADGFHRGAFRQLAQPGGSVDGDDE